MLATFSAPPRVTCILCRATISVRKGDKARFFSHISHEHEVHHDMELLYALSYMTEKEKDTVICMMDKRLTETEEVTGDSEGIETISLDESLAQDTSTDQSETEKVEKKPSKVQCPECDVTVSRKSLKAHLRLRHKVVKDGKSACKFCDKVMRKDSLGRHLRQVHGSTREEHEKMARKEEADNQTTRIKLEVVNEVLQGDDPPVDDSVSDLNPSKVEKKERKCKICFKTVRVSWYSRHLKEKHSGIAHRCRLCHVRLVRKEYLKKHLESCHKDDMHLLDDQLNPTFSKADCTFECSECEVKFITQSALDCHVMKSHGTGKEQCENCLRRFRHSWSLNKHRANCHVLSVSMP